MLFHSFLICLLENPVFSVRILLSITDFGIGLIWRLYSGRELSRYSSLKLFSIALLVLLSRSIVQMLYSADFTSSVAQRVRRAERAGFKAVALTVETLRLGRRDADLKNRLALGEKWVK